MVRHRSGVTVASVWLALIGIHAAQPPQRPVFRSGADLVIVEVVAVRRDGTPVPALGPADFQVTLDGRRREVVSADFVVVAPASGPAPAATGAVDAAGAPAPEGRLIVIAVDEHSIPVGAQASAREAVTRIIDRATPVDRLALVTFPGAVAVGPTSAHQAVREAIGRVGGRRVDVPRTRYNLSAAEAVQVRSRESLSAAELVNRECARELIRNPNCPQEVREDAAAIADTLEQQGVLTIDALQGLIDQVRPVEGRKQVFVVSAGLPTTTVPGGRPNLTAATESVARRAAEANVNLYVLYLNVHFLQHFSAASGWRSPGSLYQDISLFGTGLQRFAESAGGAFFQVEVDSDPFVDRAFRETAGYYRLAVRPDPADATGESRQIRVSTRQSGVTLRHRRFVVIARS